MGLVLAKELSVLTLLCSTTDRTSNPYTRILSTSLCYVRSTAPSQNNCEPSQTCTIKFK